MLSLEEKLHLAEMRGNRGDFRAGYLAQHSRHLHGDGVGEHLNSGTRGTDRTGKTVVRFKRSRALAPLAIEIVRG